MLFAMLRRNGREEAMPERISPERIQKGTEKEVDVKANVYGLLAVLLVGCAHIDPAVNSCLRAFACATDQSCVRACTANPYRRRALRAGDDPPGRGDNFKPRRVFYLSACEIHRGGKLIKAFGINRWIRVMARDLDDMRTIAKAHAMGQCAMQGGRMTSFKIEYILVDDW